MKIVAVIIAVWIAGSVYAEEQLKRLPFNSLPECEQAALTMLTQTANSSFANLLVKFSGRSQKARLKETSVVQHLDGVKKGAGKFLSVEAVGQASCGIRYHKLGYLVAYEKQNIFVEFIVVKTATGYGLEYSRAKANPFTPNFIADLPDYCWTHSAPTQDAPETTKQWQYKVHHARGIMNASMLKHEIERQTKNDWELVSVSNASGQDNKRSEHNYYLILKKEK